MSSEEVSASKSDQEFKVPGLVNLSIKRKTQVLSSNIFAEPEVPLPKKTDGETKTINSEIDEKKLELSNGKSDEKKKNKSSPAELLKQSELSANISYKEPEWGGVGADSGKYKLEVIKQGTVVDDISLSGKSFFVFGRLPSCDHPMDHPSISRHHAILQYRPKTEDPQHTDNAMTTNSGSFEGWYLYDMDSTHGTWVNKYRVEPQVFVRLRVGYVIKFGGSTRLFVIQGPPEDCDEESELSVTELKKLRAETEMARKMKERAEEEEEERQNTRDAFSKRNEFCTWGMEDDAEEGNPEGENPFAQPELADESLYLDDPKKSIKGFFEREGLDAPEYEFIDDSSTFSIGSNKRCRLELPVDSPNGQPVYAEVTVTGKRREAMVACALEACRMLDRLGLFRQAKHEPRSSKKRKNLEENDYYDSDDDTFLDRTGDIERKREKRMKRVMPQKGESHESLVSQQENVIKEMLEIEEALSKDDELCKKAKESVAGDDGECDELDAFMKTIKLGGLGIRTKMTMKARLAELKHLKTRLDSLVAISKPFEAKIPQGKITDKKTGSSSGLFGQRMQFSRLPLVKNEGQVKVEPMDEVEEELEEETKVPLETTDSSPSTTETNSAPEATDVLLPATEASPTPETKVKIKVEENGSLVSKEVKESTPVIKKPKTSKSNDSDPAVSNKEVTPEDNGVKTFSTRRDLSESTVVKNQDTESMWLPPEDQVGDGRTKLNERFGY